MICVICSNAMCAKTIEIHQVMWPGAPNKYAHIACANNAFTTGTVARGWRVVPWSYGRETML